MYLIQPTEIATHRSPWPLTRANKFLLPQEATLIWEGNREGEFFIVQQVLLKTPQYCRKCCIAIERSAIGKTKNPAKSGVHIKSLKTLVTCLEETQVFRFKDHFQSAAVITIFIDGINRLCHNIHMGLGIHPARDG